MVTLISPHDADFFRLGKEDIPEVVALESQCFTMPWSEKQFSLAFDQKIFSVFGLRYEEHLVGYVAIYHAAGELEILNIAVHPDFRNKGLGKRLLGLMLQVGKNMGIEQAFLEVRRSNAAAIALYEAYGFLQTGVRKKYYSDTQEDALVYCCNLQENVPTCHT